MPELPEVEALARELDEQLSGRVVRRLEVLEIAALKTVDPPLHALEGATVTGVSRRDKHLVFSCGAELHLVVHLSRSGWIRWRAGAPRPGTGRGRGPLAARLVLERAAGDEGAGGDGIDITEQASRKRLALHLVRDPVAVPSVATLGPDPLDASFTEAHFAAMLAEAGRAQIKGVLRDQHRIAGIGNAYADEILHAARMSPFHPASMRAEDVHRLWTAMRDVLSDALARARSSTLTSLKAEKRASMRVHGRAGEACPVCGERVREIIYADSTTQYCPGCQTGGTVLADRVLSRLGVRR